MAEQAEPMEVQQSGGEDEAHFCLTLQWSESDFKDNIQKQLEKRLQTWFNGHARGTDCCVKHVNKDKTAVIAVTPAPAKSVLRALNGQTLERDQRGITVIDVRSTSVDTQASAAPKKATLDQQHVKQPELQETAAEMCLLPFSHFQYMARAYDEEMKNIVRRNKVQMHSNVKVTFEAAGMDGNPTQALSEFTNLAQMCLGEYKSAALGVKNSPTEWKDLQKILQKNDKFVLTLCSDRVDVCGPSRAWDVVMNVQHRAREDESKQESGREGNIKDPLVDTGLDMEETIWRQMKVQGEVNNLKAEFGVELKESAGDQGKINVKVLNKGYGGNISSQSHAIRALLRLYQKRATACPQLFNGSMLGAAAMTSTVSNHSHVSGPPDGPPDGAADGPPDGAAGRNDPEDPCPICLDTITMKAQLKCKHQFCKKCLERSIEVTGKSCPVCKDVFGKVVGDQPDGTMKVKVDQKTQIPGFEHAGAIEISYHIPSGVQTKKHPNPGHNYDGLYRKAYLPNTPEGRKVAKLLKRAFDQKLIFTVGTSVTSGRHNQVTWNDIHHKTCITGGPQCYGYPDPDYLMRVQEELKAKGIQ